MAELVQCSPYTADRRHLRNRWFPREDEHHAVPDFLQDLGQDNVRGVVAKTRRPELPVTHNMFETRHML